MRFYDRHFENKRWKNLLFVWKLNLGSIQALSEISMNYSWSNRSRDKHCLVKKQNGLVGKQSVSGHIPTAITFHFSFWCPESYPRIFESHYEIPLYTLVTVVQCALLAMYISGGYTMCPPYWLQIVPHSMWPCCRSSLHSCTLPFHVTHHYVFLTVTVAVPALSTGV